MSDQNIPDPNLFSVNERKGEYSVSITVHGTIETTIEASSKEEAEIKAEEMCESGDLPLEITQLTDVDIDYIRPVRPMYRVIRDGENMQVSRLEAGDEPREPNEYGF